MSQSSDLVLTSLQTYIDGTESPIEAFHSQHLQIPASNIPTKKTNYKSHSHLKHERQPRHNYHNHIALRHPSRHQR